MFRTAFAATFCVMTSLFLGCGQPAAPTTGESTVANEAADASNVEMSEAAIEALAEEQKVCAVTGEPLGSMGTPVPVRVTDSKGADHTVLLCCESCREELLENPDEHLAKLEAAKAEGAVAE